MTPSLKVVVAITSPIAFHTLKNKSILQICLETAVEFVSQYGPEAHLAIAGTEEALAQIVDLDCEKIVCDPNSAQSFAFALKNSMPFEVVMIHDSQRALTKVAQFDRVLAAFTPQIDAVRPVSAFTETLKAISVDRYVAGTIDRNSMEKIATPELIRFDAIDYDGDYSAWFVPIKNDAATATVAAETESVRINSEKEIELMSHLSD